MNQKLTKVLLFSAIAASLVVLGSSSAFADNVYATIHGAVTDSTGAVVPGVQVTATNIATGVKTTTVSHDSGLYEFLQLAPGTYTVNASKNGFKTYKSTPITLKVNQVYSLAIPFQVGSTTETVEVKADAVQVETVNTQLSNVINSQQITDLPLNGRNFTQLEQLSPGVMSASDRFNTFAVNGSQTQQSSYLVNGTDSNDIPLNTPLILPSPDAIQEFSLISSTINPEYGRNSGGIVNAVIKNGTNGFHGDLFDFYRDTFLNTHNFFSSLTPQFHQNQYGGTVGGPVIKDKTFFFFSFQGTRARTGAPSLTSVFSPEQRNGDFSADAATILGNNFGQVSPIPLVGDDGVLHPAGTLMVGAGTSGAILNCGSPLTGSTCSNPSFGKIGTGNFNPLATSLMNQFVPLPNTAGNQFSLNPVNTNKANQIIFRLDHNLSSSDQIWGVGIFNWGPQTSTLPFTGANLPGFSEIDQRHTYEYTAAYNHTFSPTSLNEIRLGYARFNFDAVEPVTPALPSSFGFTGITPQNAAGASMPVLSVTGLFTLGFSTNGPQPRKDQNYQFTDNFLKIMGKHTLKFGADIRRFQVDNPFFARNDGSFSFGGAGNFTSGDPGMDFLLGIPDSYNQTAGGVINARAYEYYGYAQDSWKMKDNLTINYGAGYQIDTPYNNNQNGGLAFNCFVPGIQSTIFPSAPVGLLFPGDGGVPGTNGCTNSGTRTRFGHVAPRFGFAWSPKLGVISGDSANKFSIRGGFGVYFNRTEEEGALQNLGAPPFGVSSSGAAQPTLANPFVDLTGAPGATNIFPFTSFPQPGDPNVDFNLNSLGGVPIPGLQINVISPDLTTPYSMNFNLNVQREFPANTVVTLGYVGALGRHLYRAYEANPITFAGQAACLADPVCVANRTFQHAFFPDHSLANGDDFFTVGEQVTDGTSNYNALQLNINKGMTHGLSLITSYTWSHTIDNGSGFENSGFGNRGTNPFFPELNVGDSGNDARQRLVLGYTYQIPSLHNVMSWAPDRIFGGWKMTGITTLQTGFPVDFSDTGFRSLFCDGLTFYGCPDNPNQVAAVKTLDPRNSSFNGKKNFFFDPSNFTRQTIGTFGNTGRNSLHGPGINNTDFALLKDTKIRENLSFEMGIEGYNLFNHTQFGLPNANAASSNFGRITSAAPGRIWQLRGKFNF